ncbi:unnamed protein product, partial [Amoebophrya sp. A25]|eukprot:GSA25T00021467001.1
MIGGEGLEMISSSLSSSSASPGGGGAAGATSPASAIQVAKGEQDSATSLASSSSLQHQAPYHSRSQRQILRNSRRKTRYSHQTPLSEKIFLGGGNSRAGGGPLGSG